MPITVLCPLFKSKWKLHFRLPWRPPTAPDASSEHFEYRATICCLQEFALVLTQLSACNSAFMPVDGNVCLFTGWPWALREMEKKHTVQLVQNRYSTNISIPALLVEINVGKTWARFTSTLIYPAKAFIQNNLQVRQYKNLVGLSEELPAISVLQKGRNKYPPHVVASCHCEIDVEIIVGAVTIQDRKHAGNQRTLELWLA